jgi:hypothetical protein
MDESKVMIGDRKRRISAIAMVMLMLLSSQMYNLLNFETEDPDESVWGAVPHRTAYQQMNQASGPMSGDTQGQPAAGFAFDQVSFTDPSYHDPASYYGQVSNPAALNLDPGYGFFLEETQTEDHDNDGIDDLNDLDDDNDGIVDLIERFDGCYDSVVVVIEAGPEGAWAA